MWMMNGEINFAVVDCQIICYSTNNIQNALIFGSTFLLII